MVQTHSQKSLKLRFLLAHIYKEATSLSRTVTCANVKEKLHNVMRCLKTPSTVVKSLTFGASTLGRSRLHEGTNIYSWRSTICQNGLKAKSAPTNDAPSRLQISEISLPRFGAPCNPHEIAKPILDCPDCEDSQFCHSSRVSHPQLHLGILEVDINKSRKSSQNDKNWCMEGKRLWQNRGQCPIKSKSMSKQKNQQSNRAEPKEYYWDDNLNPILMGRESPIV
ncbi:hypothetical protein Tco_1182470 [Tanacetum coccineum]